MIGVRVDANAEIAMGHLMRCMSIVNELNEKDTVIFIVSDEVAKAFVKDKGYKCICLYNNFREKEEELEILSNIIQINNINKLLLDSYHVTEKYMSEVSKQTKIIYIDDINAFRYPADIVINYTYNTNINIYKEKGYRNTLFLLGSKYIPLREGFKQGAIKIKPKVESVLITTGGTDSYNIIMEFLQMAESRNILENVKKKVVVGALYSNFEILKKYTERNANIEIYQNISNMDEVMRSCDMAISAGGTTLAELGACGIPTVCFSMADNQLDGASAYAQDGLLEYVGDIRNNKHEVLCQMITKVDELQKDIQKRRCLNFKMATIIDGKGAMRIAEAIDKL